MAEATVVKFGTDGWRGIIADDFTYANVRVAARAIANYVLKHEDAKRGVCVAYDTRFGSRSFAPAITSATTRANERDPKRVSYATHTPRFASSCFSM